MVPFRLANILLFIFGAITVAHFDKKTEHILWQPVMINGIELLHRMP